MSLKYIVPSMGLMALSVAPAMAADVGGLTIDGYVDTVLEISSLDDAIAPVAKDGSEDGTIIDFSAAAQLEVGYAIGNDVSANLEVFFTDADDGTATVDLEQAYVGWAVNDQFTITMGKFHNWIGWEGNDSPELYRVNHSVLARSPGWGEDVTGVGFGAKASDEFSFGFYIVDAIYGDGNTQNAAFDFDAAAVDKESTDLGIGADATYTMEGVGRFDLDLAFDMGATDDPDDATANSDVFGISFNGEITALQQDNGLLFAWDLMYVDYDVAAGLGLMVMANYKLPTEFPASATLMITYLDPNDDDDAGGTDDEVMEIAAALLTNPTDDENFSLNFELRYIDRAADDSSEFGIFVEALAVIP